MPSFPNDDSVPEWTVKQDSSYLMITSTTAAVPRVPLSTWHIPHMFQVGSGAAFSAASRRLRREVPAPERANMPLRGEASTPDEVPAPDGAKPDSFDISHGEIKLGSFDVNNSVHFVEFIKDIIVKSMTWRQIRAIPSFWNIPPHNLYSADVLIKRGSIRFAFPVKRAP